LSCGDVTRVPAGLIKEKVFVVVEAKERDGLKVAITVLAEEDRVFALHPDELGREDQGLVDVVAELGRVTGPDPEILVRDVVEYCSPSHWGSPK
jgi:hypothetical protein